MPPHSSREDRCGGCLSICATPRENVHRLPDCLIAFVNDKAFANDNEDKAVYSVTSRRQDNRTPSGLSQARGVLGRWAAMLHFAAKPSRSLWSEESFFFARKHALAWGHKQPLRSLHFPDSKFLTAAHLNRTGEDPASRRGKMQFGTPERWQSGRMRRFAKPLYGLTPVPRVRIPPSPPSFQLLTVHQITLQIS